MLFAPFPVKYKYAFLKCEKIPKKNMEFNVLNFEWKKKNVSTNDQKSCAITSIDIPGLWYQINDLGGAVLQMANKEMDATRLGLSTKDAADKGLWRGKTKNINNSIA